MNKKIEPPASEEEYYKASVAIRLSYAPKAIKCEKCGWPTIDGYCCYYCGDENPTEK